MSPLRHVEQLLLVTSCDSPAGIGASLRTHEWTNGWTDRHDVGNSILDVDGNVVIFSKFGGRRRIQIFSSQKVTPL